MEMSCEVVVVHTLFYSKGVFQVLLEHVIPLGHGVSTPQENLNRSNVVLGHCL